MNLKFNFPCRSLTFMRFRLSAWRSLASLCNSSMIFIICPSLSISFPCPLECDPSTPYLTSFPSCSSFISGIIGILPHSILGVGYLEFWPLLYSEHTLWNPIQNCQAIKLHEYPTIFIINTNKNESYFSFTSFLFFVWLCVFRVSKNSILVTSGLPVFFFFGVSQLLMSRFTILSDSRSPISPFYVLALLSLALDSYDHAPRPWLFPSHVYSYRGFGPCAVNRRMSSQLPILRYSLALQAKPYLM
jgi:hypothetical protein